MKNKQQFKGIWLPAEIWQAQDLSLLEKVLLAQVDNLSQKDKGCFASNAYLANFFGVSARHISNSLSNLAKKGLLKIVIDKAKGNERIIYTLLNRTSKPYGSKHHNPIEADFHYIIKDITKDITKNSSMAKNEFLPEQKPEENINDDNNNHSILQTKNVLNDIPASPQPRSFKQWTEKEFGNEIAQLFNEGEIKGITKQAARDFYDYWRELSPNGKMRFQLQKTWQTNLRLNTWVRRQFEGKPFGQQQAGNDSKPNHRILA